MDIFQIRDQVVGDYESFVKGYIRIRDSRIKSFVDEKLREGALWPDPLIQLSPSFQRGGSISELIQQGLLHSECGKIFKIKAHDRDPGSVELTLHKHQVEALQVASKRENYVVTTGTGSGKSLTYIVPIVNDILKSNVKKTIKAIIVYPMNALANSQKIELEKFIQYGYPDRKGPVTFERYTGQDRDEERRRIIANPPDILLTNYVMLELILTRPEESPIVLAATDLKYLVFDELHTYRGRQGADVAMLIRRVREFTQAKNMVCIGTSATLSSRGTFREQCEDTAKVAGLIFGTDVKSENVIGESLIRVTSQFDESNSDDLSSLKKRMASRHLPQNFNELIADPLYCWIESHFGLKKDPDRLVRQSPQPLISSSEKEGSATFLARISGLSEGECIARIREALLWNYSSQVAYPHSGKPPFAFRLHQFISRGDAVRASLAQRDSRYLTLIGQPYNPHDRSQMLLPLAFCRECGQDFFTVRRVSGGDGNPEHFEPRDMMDRVEEDGVEHGFLYYNPDKPWPESLEQAITENLIPDDWLTDQNGNPILKRDRRKDVPKPVAVNLDGTIGTTVQPMTYFPRPFRFCLNCGVAYSLRSKSDFDKLTALGSEGRSTATTILSLSTIRNLRESETDPKKRKLLSFMDNRQDASLQAGHLNDFLEIALLRSAVLKAVNNAGNSGLTHEVLPEKIYDALGLKLQDFAVDPTARFQRREETIRALRSVIGYRIFRDLRRGWRIMAPNLEQCGLLRIEYPSLTDLCNANEEWNPLHTTLANATAEARERVCKVLLDHLRRSLAIKVDYLAVNYQDQIRQLSNQHLKAPWGLDEDEQFESSVIAFPRSGREDEANGVVTVSPRGSFGSFIRRKGNHGAFPEYGTPIGLDECQVILKDLFKVLRVAGLVEEIEPARTPDEVPGYQIPASSLIWKKGDPEKPYFDPIRIPRPSRESSIGNAYFTMFYTETATKLLGVEAREHTAQVDPLIREQREQSFREAKLPILYCTPTMELGIDISELNFVHMRNMPPTPANYAQRSGRAGRTGQPALITTYCSTGSPHDQYFFHRQDRMVSGAVTPPRIDLTNEDLILSHIQAVWLTETKLDLRTSITELLIMDGTDPSLDLRQDVQDKISNPSVPARAKSKALSILTSMSDFLKDSGWYHDRWLDDVIKHAPLAFQEALSRWRTLYKSALQQRDRQYKIMNDFSLPEGQRIESRRLHDDALNQLKLLNDVRSIVQSDFYSYRYFASEGFLPGYNFPRLPISAFVPGRRARGEESYLSRPRFLAISEFGPRALIYHEGSRYRINRVIMPVGDEQVEQRAKFCPACGYLHPITANSNPDLCERCKTALDMELKGLFRMQNVATKRADRINSDEEERRRLGYELRTTVRFAEKRGDMQCRSANAQFKGNVIAEFDYGPTATLWRMNLGEKRRKNQAEYGHRLDMERGYWATQTDEEEAREKDPLSQRIHRVIPFVEDRRNCLIFTPSRDVDLRFMATLQAALKTAIQVCFQLEDSELLTEPLPSVVDRRSILFYEAAEGGAGVLRRLVNEPEKLVEVAKTALELCHMNTETGKDIPTSKPCATACYDCLMSYFNQPDHLNLDRLLVRDYLLELARAEIKVSPKGKSRKEHLETLKGGSGSSLERKFLELIEHNLLRLPTHGQHRIDQCLPDFFYEDQLTVIYVDGPPHDTADNQKRDHQLTTHLEDKGYTVLRFHHEDDWIEIIKRYPNVFGELK